MKTSSKNKSATPARSSTGKSKSAPKADKDKAKASKDNKKSKRPGVQKETHGYVDGASALLSQGKQAVDGAYEWVAESAERMMPDRRPLQNLFEEQPLIVGAIGLGIGAVIGMMIPGHAMSSDTGSQRKR